VPETKNVAILAPRPITEFYTRPSAFEASYYRRYYTNPATAVVTKAAGFDPFVIEVSQER